MRLLHITVPPGRRDAVLSVLDQRSLPYVLADDESGRDVDAVATTPVQDDAVEGVIEELKQAGVSEEYYIVVLDVNALVDGVIEEPTEPEDDDDEEGPPERIAREELHTRATELITSTSTFGTMTAVSSIVAAAGILMDSAAVVVGSMVIAPLIGPSLAASVGTVLDDRELSRAGVRLQLFGILIAIVAATSFAFLVKHVHLVPPDLLIAEIGQVRERLSPDFLALAIALGAGIAGALSLATGVSAALVGVMIAVALIPPAAVIGIGIAWGFPTVVLGASVLLVLNVLAINLAALGVLWHIGFRPASWFKTAEARSKTFRRVGVLVTAILLISLFLGGATVGSYQMAQQEEVVAGGIHDVLDDPRYDHLEVVEIEIERDDRPFFARPDRVVVTVGRPAGTPVTAVADPLATTISDRLDRPVSIEVVHIERERSASDDSNGNTGS